MKWIALACIAGGILLFLHGVRMDGTSDDMDGRFIKDVLILAGGVAAVAIGAIIFATLLFSEL